MTQLTDKTWAVGILDTVINFKQFTKAVKNEEADIPVGKFQFLFTTKAATEEDARKVVKQLNNGVYHDYAHSHFDPCDEYAPCYLEATESLASLLRSKGLDENKNYAIIEKLK